MKNVTKQPDRRTFIKATAFISAGLFAPFAFNQSGNGYEVAASEALFVIGPRKGYSPQIGVLVSMLNYNRHTILQMVQSLTMKQLDHLHDPKANSIGALILHLGAVDKYYQVNTFEGRQDFNNKEKAEWDAALNLGDDGRKSIKGHDLQYYIDRITSVREHTLKELKERDDKWLSRVDPTKKEPVNNYWKWFHVCEHESNHRGQIAWLKGRLPDDDGIR
jgi:uncharacterized damage-inducible protein DinB